MATDSDDVVELTALLSRVMGEPLAPLHAQAERLQESIGKQHSETDKKLKALSMSLLDTNEKTEELESQTRGLKADIARENGKLLRSLDSLCATSDAQQTHLMAQLDGLRTMSDSQQADLLAQLGGLRTTADSHQTDLLARLDGLRTTADSHQTDLLTQLDGLRTAADSRQAGLVAQFDGLRASYDSHQKDLLARLDVVDRLSAAVDELGALQRQQAVTGRDTLAALQSLSALADRLRAHVGQLDAAIVGQVDNHVERRLSEIRASMQSSLETTSAATRGHMRGQWHWLMGIGLLNLAGVAGVAALYLAR